jgi:hypothetical protein
VPCWEPVQDKEACGKRCRCEWQDWEKECLCAKLLHVPMCQVYFPQPDISSLMSLAITNPGLKPSDRIVLLGDSITWCVHLTSFAFGFDHLPHDSATFSCSYRLGGYQVLLELAFHELGLKLYVSNRGYNGGKTADIVYGNTEVTPVWVNIDTVLAEDNPTIVMILMGTNDVIVQRNAATVEVRIFPSYRILVDSTAFHHDCPHLGAITDASKEISSSWCHRGCFQFVVRFVVLNDYSHHACHGGFCEWISTFGEQKPEFQERFETINGHTAGLKRICDKTGAVFTDLRADVLAYEASHNVRTPKGLTWGILTSDQTHPCLTDAPPCNPFTHGNYIIANAVARGLIQALRSRG